jgi:hypothetical protein
MPDALVRLYRLGLALLIVAAVGVQYAHSARTSPVFSPVNYVSYFTNDSNVLTAAVFALLALRPRTPIAWWRGLAVVCMTITGVVFALLLRGETLAPLPWVNAVVHEIAPIIVAADWIIVPSAQRISRAAMLGWLVPPFAWLAYTLVRGVAVGWYPYPFLDVNRTGVASVVTTCVAIFAGFVVTVALVGVIGNRKAPSA